MKFLFCSDPLDPNRPDVSYQDEVEAAQAAGFEYELFDFEQLTRGNVTSAVRRIKNRSAEELAIYRGWMLRPRAYEQLYAALQERNIVLINSPAAYRHCHYLPESFSVIANHTPATVWLPPPQCLEMKQVVQQLAIFGDKPLILKDYVKSRKHDWATACFIPSASDTPAVERIVKRFLELQGDELNEGLVFREFVSLQEIGTHSKSGMPLTKEFRFFFFNAQLLHSSEYWMEGDYSNGKPPLEMFQEIAGQVQSRFFTMDVAQHVDGAWMIVELGDAQVAGLPNQMDAGLFYQALQNRV